MEAPTIPRGYCIACGYSLQGLPAGAAGYRCPECGRAFNPANPKTFRNTPQGRLASWLVKPMEWPMVCVSLAAAIGVMSVSRWKLSAFAPSAVDLFYYLRPEAIRNRSSLVTWRDYVFTLSMLGAIFVFCYWLVRSSARELIQWHTGIKEDDRPADIGRRRTVFVIAMLVTVGGAILGWPYRLAQHCVALRLAANKTQLPRWTPRVPVALPADISPEEIHAVVRAAVLQLPQTQQRMAGLSLLMEQDPAEALPILIEAVGSETDPQIRAMELRLIGLHRDPTTLRLLMSFVNDLDAEMRAAAVDAIGILHAPAYTIPLLDDSGGWNPFGAAAALGTVAIDLSQFIALHAKTPRVAPDSIDMTEIPLSADCRAGLERMMLTAATTEEREAAARALVTWPPKNYKLRVAEWGMWINDHGELKLVQSVLDEIPPFVHRTGNSLGELNSRINTIMIVTKPVIHITVDRPMAVDVKVVIDQGRPWFAYPNPDDFAVRVETLYEGLNPQKPAPLAPLENPAIGKLADVRQGYPWLEPHHIVSGPSGSLPGGVNELTGLGLRWQSLIVSPTRLPWMTLPDVGPNPRYAWWGRLREVPSAWVSSHGESERFLYYDGPTLATTHELTFAGNKLQLARGKKPDQRSSRRYGMSAAIDPLPPQQALLIHHREGQLTGQAVPKPAAWDNTDESYSCTIGQDDLRQEQVIDKFRAQLKEVGLSTEEAEGLVASWQKQFFQTDGTRLLLIMSRQDYDHLCPIRIRPQPTETARVGIVLTEFK
jgi:hypothetical protein